MRPRSSRPLARGSLWLRLPSARRRSRPVRIGTRRSRTIAEGTGATGDNLKGLTEDFQGVARWGPNAAAAVADLNTHLGLAGPELRRVAEAALKAKIDTNAFGGIVKQTDRDVDGYVQLLDQLTAASQMTGASSQQLTQAIGRNSARWIAAGGDMEGLIATVVQAADEFGPAGLRGAMSQVMEEVDKGLVPAVTNLDALLGDVTGRVESTYQAGRTWRDVIKENTSALLAQVDRWETSSAASARWRPGCCMPAPR